MTITAQQNARKRLAFATQTYHLDSLPASAQRILNVYPEDQPAEALTGATLRSVAGLTTVYDLGSGPVFALNSDRPGFLYAVVGSNFYRVPAGGPPVNLGAVPQSTLPIADGYPPTIAVGPDFVVVCSPPNVYVAAHTDSSINQITGTSDAPFPGASSVAYIDGYFVFTQVYTAAQFFTSGLLSPTNYDGLDFATAETRPNVIKRVVLHRGELWFFGEGGNEVWYDAGAVDFAFRRRTGADTALGCIAPGSIAAVSQPPGLDSLIYLGSDNMVYMTNGYQPIRVSTYAIETIIQNRILKHTASAFAYPYEGHYFYCITFPASASPTQAAITLAYDVTTSRWHERVSGTDPGPWRPLCAALSSTSPVFGDSITGRIYTFSPGVEDDDGLAKPWIATLPPVWGDTDRAILNRLTLEMQPASAQDAQVALEMSDDGGYTFSPKVFRDATQKRVFWTRRGSFRERVLRFSGTGAVTLYGASAEIDQGAA